jgi:ribosome maturation factor RimP
MPGKYRLEVSSPGLGRPLKLPQQYVKNIGRKLDVTHKTSDGDAKMEGILQAASATTITLTDKKKVSVAIAIADIVEAYVVPSMQTLDR